MININYESQNLNDFLTIFVEYLNISQILNVLKKIFSLKHVTFTLQLSFGLFTFLFSKLSKLDKPSWVKWAADSFFGSEKSEKWKLKFVKN